MKKTRILIFIASLFMAFTASAHVGLKSSSPSASEVLYSSPEQLNLTFSNEVRLVKLQLQNAAGEGVGLEFKASANASAQFNNTLPKLKAGEYTVIWTVLGLDGHKMSDTFNFTLSECESGKSAHEDKESHPEHDNN